MTTKATPLEVLYFDLRAGRVDMTDDLPTFGGSEPGSTRGVWSWDTDRLLIGTCVGDLRIVARSENPNA